MSNLLENVEIAISGLVPSGSASVQATLIDCVRFLLQHAKENQREMVALKKEFFHVRSALPLEWVPGAESAGIDAVLSPSPSRLIAGHNLRPSAVIYSPTMEGAEPSVATLAETTTKVIAKVKQMQLHLQQVMRDIGNVRKKEQQQVTMLHELASCNERVTHLVSSVKHLEKEVVTLDQRFIVQSSNLAGSLSSAAKSMQKLATDVGVLYDLWEIPVEAARAAVSSEDTKDKVAVLHSVPAFRSIVAAPAPTHNRSLPFLGVELADGGGPGEGVRVMSILEGGAVNASGGIFVGDSIIAVNHIPVDNRSQFQSILQHAVPEAGSLCFRRRAANTHQVDDVLVVLPSV